MKNFRKVLALILVVATLFSFVAMASAKSATEYEDYTDVTYVEAVDVLTALGIINGYDGKFHPADTIERGEMAKMIAVLRNAGDFDAAQFASANKFADTKGHWAEGYVAYCNQLGIIAGQNATTFAPDAAVKGVDVLKMLLCVLGFDAEKQGYVGANYEVSVIRDANKMGLLAGLATVDLYEPATRDQAAQMFLNALKADMVVGYVGEGIVKMTNSLYVFSAGELLEVSLYEVEKLGWEILTNTNAVLSYTPLYEIYGKGILTVTDVVDCYGRPAVKWTITDAYGIAILDKTYAAPADFSYTEKVDLETEYAGLFAKYLTVVPTVETYVDGAKIDAADTLDEASAYTGNGVKTEVYVDGTAIRVVIINTYIAEVASVTKFPTATVTLNNGYTFKNTLGLEVEDIVLYNKCAGAPKDNAALKATDASGATVAYIHDIWEIAPTTETVIHASFGLAAVQTDAYETLDLSYFQTAEKKFEYARNFGNTFNTGAATDTDVLSNGDVKDKANIYDVYVDQYGFVMWYKPHVDTPDYKYAYIVENTQNLGAVTMVDGKWLQDCSFDLVNYDGTAGAKTAAEDQATIEEEITRTLADNAAYLQGNLAKYVLDSKGRVDVKTYGTFAADTAKVVKDVAEILNAGAQKPVYADNTTQYMVRTYNYATGKFAYNVYIGYNNLPDTLFGYKNVGDEATKIQTLQYLVKESHTYGDIVSHVFIDATYAGAAEYFFLLNAKSLDSETALYPFLKGYTVYTALVGGEKVAVAVSDANGNWDGNFMVDGYNAAEVNKLYKANMKLIDGVTINGLKIYMAMGAVDNAEYTVIAGPANGLFTIAEHLHKQIAADAAVHVIYEYEDEWTYKTFKGETRDADFAGFFQYSDWSAYDMVVYDQTKKVGQYGITVDEVTELWIVLTPKTVA